MANWVLWSILAVWIACGVLHYGFWVAYFTREYPSVSSHVGERAFGVFGVLFGPVAIMVDCTTGWLIWGRSIFAHGWRL